MTIATRLMAAGWAVLLATSAQAQGTNASPDTKTTVPPAAAQTPAQGSNGVIQPPSTVDPGIRKPAPSPQAFPTPVVPPPGTPGGNPNVIAK